MGLVVLTCFFLSGASGLVFEEVWTRDLTLVFGSTTLALSTVLSVFMGGLALGSRLGGRFADRIQDRLRAYALAEAGVGLYALVVPFILASYPALNHALYRLFGQHSVALSLGRFVAAALLLLIPTTLMGATLPILSRHFVLPGSKTSRIGATVGTLYAINTFGAVVGTFVGGFLLLPGAGVKWTNYTAAATNLTLAALVMIVRRRADRLRAEGVLEETPPLAEPTPTEDAPDGSPDARDDGFVATPAQRRLALIAFAVSGAVAMVYQVLWTRSLAIVLGSSVYSFTLILLAFLIGLGFGAAIVARLSARSRRPLEWLGAVHAGTAAMIALSYIVMDKLPAAFLALLRGQVLSVDGIIFCQFLLAALAVLPATLLMGGVLPLTVRIYASGADRVGRDVGTAYSINTLGAIIGSFAAGFVVLPVLGLQRGLALGGILTVGLAGAFFWLGQSRFRHAIAVSLPAIAVCVSLVLPRWSLEHFSAGLFRVSIARDIIQSNKWAVPKLEYYKDGIATTVSVERWGKTVALKNNGKVDASNGDDMSTQIMVGLMPFLFHPTALKKPPRSLVIGFGSGVTAGAVTQFPIGHADVVELEPTVVDAGVRFFGPYNHHPEQDPRVSMFIGDGRNFLTQRDDKYDVIVSEPSNPWITGVSNLFTIDYWKLARSRLADDGVFCQWFQLYEMSSKNVKTVLRSFASVFPYTYVFAAEDLSSDVIMIAANHPLSLDLPSLRRNWGNAVLAAELKRGGVPSAEDLVAQLLLVPEELPAFTAGSPINTDDNALIEFNAPRDLLGSTRTADPYLARVYAAEWPYGRFDRHLQYGGDRANEELALARALLAHGKRGAAERFLAAAHQHGATRGAPVERLLESMRERNVDDREVPLSDGENPKEDSGLSGLDPPRMPPHASADDQAKIGADYLQVEKAVRARAWAHALWALRKWPETWIDEGGPDLQLLLGYLLYKADLPDEAVDKLKPLLDEPGYADKRPALLYYLSRAEYGDGIFDASVRNMEKWLSRTRPEDLPPPFPPAPTSP
jgi:spermidine synthase